MLSLLISQYQEETESTQPSRKRMRYLTKLIMKELVRSISYMDKNELSFLGEFRNELMDQFPTTFRNKER